MLENHATEHADRHAVGEGAASGSMREFQLRLIGGPTFRCRDGEAALAAMERQGLSEVIIGCRNGGCGVCRVLVTSGRYRLGKISRAQVTEAEQSRGITLACRLYPETDIEMIVIASRKGAAKSQ